MLKRPTTVSFSGHDTFPFRYGWMKKGVDAAAADGSVFSRDEAMTVLGVGKNMVRSIRHWGLATGMLEEYQPSPESRGMVLRPSAVGEAVFSDDGWDPYLEDPATLWLLHWQIASNVRRATTWFWAFSYVFDPEFTRDGLISALQQWVDTAGWKRIAPSSLKRDVDCFLRTYVPSRQTQGTVLEDTLDCPLVELNLVREAGDRQTFQYVRGPQSDLPTGVLLYATLDYWQRSASNAETLSLHDLAYQPGSPGRLFQIDEDSLAARYEQVEEWTDRQISYGETAGLKQLYRRRPVPPARLLERAYGASTASRGGARRA
jgi:hypothetical protein